MEPVETRLTIIRKVEMKESQGAVATREHRAVIRNQIIIKVVAPAIQEWQ